jgi:polysaccharide pyruvyl transferase WcaK-like protein
MRNCSPNRKKTKVALLGASFDTCNMGVSALAAGGVKCIFRKWPDAEVIFLGAGRSPGEVSVRAMGRDYRIRAIPIRFCVNIFLPNHFITYAFYALLLWAVPVRRLRDFLLNRNEYVKLIWETSVFADITGGDSFSDIYGMRRFVLGCLQKLVPVMFKKELVLLPQTYGPFRSPIARLMARYILRKSSVVYSRDRAGVEVVKEILKNGEDKVRFVPDVAFVLDPEEPKNMGGLRVLVEKRTDRRVVVGLNVSGLLYSGGYTGHNMFGLREDYQRIVEQIMEFFMTKSKVVVVLIPHVFPSGEFADIAAVEDDVSACVNIYGKYCERHPGRVFIASEPYDQSEIKYVIGLCDFFIGSRMHACVAALSQRIPAVGLAYSDKFLGVFDSVGVGELVVDIRKQTGEGIIGCVNRIFSDRNRISAVLAEKIPEAQKTIFEVFGSGRGT